MFKVIYHYLVVRDDIPKLSNEWREKVRSAIEKRLTARPELYGKPLRHSLRGYRKLRVGDWRVIFGIERDTVKIIVIQHRSVAYADAKKRA